MAAAGWFAFPWIQTQRADAVLTSANQHIDDANELVTQVRIEALTSASFSSLENINLALEAVTASRSLFEKAQQESAQAATETSSAAGYARLPSWYSEYLLKKHQIAELRSRQAQTLIETVDRLQPLYENGQLIFETDQEMDRLLGQFQQANAKVQSDPGEAIMELEQVATALRSVQQRLQTGYESSGFELLDRLALNAGNQADLAELSGQLADAASAGDQARAQTIAQQLETKLLEISTSQNTLDSWKEERLTPLKNEYEALQAEEERLDAEARELFQNR
jgi:hypothetical protein